MCASGRVEPEDDGRGSSVNRSAGWYGTIATALRYAIAIFIAEKAANRAILPDDPRDLTGRWSRRREWSERFRAATVA